MLVVSAAPSECFVCPLDGGPFASTANGVSCAAGHAFDRAREGYLNLLPVQHKASLNPGDDKTMVAARTRVLDDGCFAPVADKLFELAQAGLAPARDGGPLRIVDAGCGEGYYLARLVEAAQASVDPRAIECAGTDISKWAVRAAARRCPAVAWAVASNRRLPFAPRSVHLIVSAFGFPVWASFQQVQAPGGCVLLVDAGPGHLLELRRVIYPTVELSGPPPLLAAEACGYRVGTEARLVYPTDLAGQSQIQAITAMTPHAHRMPPAGREALARLARLTVTIDVVFRLLPGAA